tara:strand:+ start:222 stop:1268 length:1047 start_codon:yes stop_codon:yes gene_type:complete
MIKNYHKLLLKRKRKKKIKVGIIGLGVVGKRRRFFIERNKDYQLTCASDINFKNNFCKNNINYYKDYKTLISKENINAVFITLPTYLAAKVTKLFLSKKIHVFCEKPPAKNYHELNEVIKLEKKLSLIKLKYGFNHRYHNSVRVAKKIIDSKKFGGIINIRAVYGKSKIVTYNKNEWRAQKKFSGGGILLDQGIHLIDLIRFFAGDFIKFKSFISKSFWNYDVEDNAFALLQSKKGLIASIHSTATQWEHKFRMEITLERCLIILSGILSGSKTYGDEKIAIIPKQKINFSTKNVKKKIFVFKKDNSWKEEIEEFAEIIKKDKKVLTGNSFDALQVMKMIYKIYQNDK